jgi:hypothetical protein
MNEGEHAKLHVKSRNSVHGILSAAKLVNTTTESIGKEI